MLRLDLDPMWLPLGRVGLAALLVWIPASTAAQAPGDESGSPDVAVMGQVVDQATGAPIAGAWVSFEGRRRGVSTDDRGIFYLRDPKGGSDRVTIEMLGYGVAYVPTSLVDESPPVRIPLESDPIVLEGFEIVSDRFHRRRNASPTSVRMFGTQQLRMSPASDVMQFLETRTFIREEPCGFSAAANAAPRTCARIRGRTTPVIICIDEVPMLGGFAILRTFSPADLHMLEVYGSGRQIRVYTRAFMEQASRVRLNPQPIEFGC